MAAVCCVVLWRVQGWEDVVGEEVGCAEGQQAVSVQQS